MTALESETYLPKPTENLTGGPIIIWGKWFSLSGNGICGRYDER
jgi:hypothetical protein